MNARQSRAWQALDIGPALVGRSSESTSVPAVKLSWTEMVETVDRCQLCQRCTAREHPVFGLGSSKPRWLIIGIAPGELEDPSGKNVGGLAGQLMEAMLYAVGANDLEHIYLTNILKCGSAQEQDPLPDDVAKCRPYLERQIQLLQPDLILTLGQLAAQTLLRTDERLGELRGRVHQVECGDGFVPTVASYHPADLMRRPEDKAQAWADLCLARSVVAPEPASA